jgi:hypothetical protein
MRYLLLWTVALLNNRTGLPNALGYIGPKVLVLKERDHGSVCSNCVNLQPEPIPKQRSHHEAHLVLRRTWRSRFPSAEVQEPQ